MATLCSVLPGELAAQKKKVQMHEPEPQATALRLLPEACPPSREEPPSPSSKFQPCQPDSVTLPAIGQSYTGLRVPSAQQTLVNRPLRAIGPPLRGDLRVALVGLMHRGMACLVTCTCSRHPVQQDTFTPVLSWDSAGPAHTARPWRPRLRLILFPSSAAHTI